MRSNEPRPTASIAVRTPLLRNLLREDLEHGGFEVTSVSAGACVDPADVVVTDSRSSRTGEAATVYVGPDLEFRLPSGTVVYPGECFDRIPEILRTETLRRRP